MWHTACATDRFEEANRAGGLGMAESQQQVFAIGMKSVCSIYRDAEYRKIAMHFGNSVDADRGFLGILTRH